MSTQARKTSYTKKALSLILALAMALTMSLLSGCGAAVNGAANDAAGDRGVAAVQSITFNFANATVVNAADSSSIVSGTSYSTDANGDITLTVTPSSGYGYSQTVVDPAATVTSTDNGDGTWTVAITGVSASSYASIGIPPYSITFFGFHSSIGVSGGTINADGSITAPTDSNGNINFTITPDSGMSLLQVSSSWNQNGAREPLTITDAGGGTYSVRGATFDGDVYAICWSKTPSTSSTFSGGSGTEANPWVIGSEADLAQLAADVFDAANGGNNYERQYFILSHSLDLNTSLYNPWLPIGGGAAGALDTDPDNVKNYSFQGNFNGDNSIAGGNLTISGVEYNYLSGNWSRGNTAKNNIGLFGQVNFNGTVRYVTLASSSIAAQRAVGGIVGKNFGTVDNCIVLGNVTVSSNDTQGTGGVVGASWLDATESPVTVPTVSNCTSAASVTSSASNGSAGGIVGENEGLVYNCSNTGSITSQYNAGGIVGSNQNNKQQPDTETYTLGYISNCYNSGSITGGYAGGILGYQLASAANVYSNGTVVGSTATGEIIGQLDSGAATSANNDNLFRRLDALPTVGLVTSGTFNGHTADAHGDGFEYDPTGADPDSLNLSGLNSALNTWVTANQPTPPIYKEWTTTGSTSGYPIFRS